MSVVRSNRGDWIGRAAAGLTIYRQLAAMLVALLIAAILPTLSLDRVDSDRLSGRPVAISEAYADPSGGPAGGGDMILPGDASGCTPAAGTAAPVVLEFSIPSSHAPATVVLSSAIEPCEKGFAGIPAVTTLSRTAE